MLFFPQLFTALAFALAVVTFFSSYHSATGLKNVSFMTLNLTDLSVEGYTLSSISKLTGTSASISPYYSIGMNGWCYGEGAKNMTACVTPSEPFYFNFEILLDEFGLGSLMSYLPSELQEYNDLSKSLTQGAWGSFLAAMILIFIQFVCGFIAICSNWGTCLTSCFSILATAAAAVGAGMATGVYYAYKSKINDNASSFGVSAGLNASGFGCAWATVAALLIADVLIFFIACFSHKKTRYVTLPEKDHVYTEAF